MSYFMPRTNRLYALVLPLAAPYRWALTCLVIGIPLYAWLTLLYWPNAVLYAKQKAAILQHQQHQQELAPKRQQIAQLQEQIKQATATLHEHHEKGATHQEPMAYLFDAATQAGVALRSCSLNKHADKKWYAKKHLQVELQGKLPHLVLFFDTVKKSRQMIHGGDVHLARADDGTYTATWQASVIQVIARI